MIVITQRRTMLLFLFQVIPKHDGVYIGMGNYARWLFPHVWKHCVRVNCLTTFLCSRLLCCSLIFTHSQVSSLYLYRSSFLALSVLLFSKIKLYCLNYVILHVAHLTISQLFIAMKCIQYQNLCSLEHRFYDKANS